MFVEDNNIYIGGTNVLPEWGKVVDDSKSLSEEQQKEMRSNVIERIQKMFVIIWNWIMFLSFWYGVINSFRSSFYTKHSVCR